MENTNLLNKECRLDNGGIVDLKYQYDDTEIDTLVGIYIEFYRKLNKIIFHVKLMKY